MQFNVKWDGKERVMKILNGLNSRCKDLRPAYEEVTKQLMENEEEAFDQQGRTKRWRALSKNYAAWKSKNYPGRGILIRTGDLSDSLTKAKARGTVRRVKKMEMAFGTNIKYAKFHQDGTRSLYIRKPLDIKKSDHSAFAKTIRNFILFADRLLKRS